MFLLHQLNTILMIKPQGGIIMYLSYDEAVKIGSDAYLAFEYANSCCYSFRLACRDFKEYMEERSLPYSLELAKEWINDSKKCWNNYKFESSTKAIRVLSDIIENGCVTTSLQTKFDRTSHYLRLPNWSKTFLDNYLATLTCNYRNSYISQIRSACSRFFLFLELTGISEYSEITHNIVKVFFMEDIHASPKAKDRCNNEIDHCLMYMAEHGLIPKTVGLTLNKFVIPNLIIVSELSELERNKFLRFYNTDKNIDISETKAEYDAAAMQLIDIHKSKKYATYIRNTDSQAVKDFRIFMDANIFAYSNDLALEWLKFQKLKWSHSKYLAFRRVLLSINELLCTKTLLTSCFSFHESKYSLPEWGEGLLSQYLQERKLEGCTTSTLDMIRNSCSRFIVFLDNNGILSENGITPQIIKNFQAQDNHSTVEGKNAYAIKIRGFLRFLSRNGLITETLELAVSTEMAPHTTIVTILSDNQIDDIYTFRQHAHNPIELRNAAIIILGLRMGLRGSDIANLKLSDISWKESSISFVQQKTGVYLKLPLPVDVGNSLYRYICEGRPPSNFHNIFVHHRAPYCNFKKAGFGRLLKTAITVQNCDEAIKGFHVTRKTFASKLLINGNPVTTIATALGHVGVDSVDEYLATNEEQMRLCAIGLNGIEYSGGFSL